MTMVPVALVDLSALMQVATAGSTSTTDGIAKAPVVVVPVPVATVMQQHPLLSEPVALGLRNGGRLMRSEAPVV
jgi:hypothetical protein